MRRSVSATEARVHLGELLRQVRDEHATILIERNGAAQAFLVSVEEYQHLRGGQRSEEWEALLDRTRDLIRADLAGRRLPPADETIREMREERDANLLGLR